MNFCLLLGLGCWTWYLKVLTWFLPINRVQWICPPYIPTWNQNYPIRHSFPISYKFWEYNFKVINFTWSVGRSLLAETVRRFVSKYGINSQWRDFLELQKSTPSKMSSKVWDETSVSLNHRPRILTQKMIYKVDMAVKPHFLLPGSNVVLDLQQELTCT